MDKRFYNGLLWGDFYSFLYEEGNPPNIKTMLHIPFFKVSVYAIRMYSQVDNISKIVTCSKVHLLVKYFCLQTIPVPIQLKIIPPPLRIQECDMLFKHVGLFTIF